MISILESLISILLYVVIIIFSIYLFKKFNIKLLLLILLFIIFSGIIEFVGEHFFNIDNSLVFFIISLVIVSIVNIIITTLQYKNNEELRLSAIYKILFFYVIIDNHNNKKGIEKIFSWLLLPVKLLFTNELTTIRNRKSIYLLNLIWIVVFLISSIFFVFDKIEIGISLYLILAISIFFFKIFDK